MVYGVPTGRPHETEEEIYPFFAGCQMKDIN